MAIKKMNFVKNKKYYVITIDNKRVNWGDINMEDYLIHHDKDRRDKFRARFKKLFDNHKTDYNKPIFWSYNLTW